MSLHHDSAFAKCRILQRRNFPHRSAEMMHMAVLKSCIWQFRNVSHAPPKYHIIYIRYISHIACRKSQCRSVAYRRAEISHITMAKSCISQCRNTAYRSAEISHIAMAQCRLSIYRNDIGDDKLSMIMIIYRCWKFTDNQGGLYTCMISAVKLNFCQKPGRMIFYFK